MSYPRLEPPAGYPAPLAATIIYKVFDFLLSIDRYRQALKPCQCLQTEGQQGILIDPTLDFGLLNAELGRHINLYVGPNIDGLKGTGVYNAGV